MKKKDEPVFRQTLLFASTIAALGMSMGVPVTDILAATDDSASKKPQASTAAPIATNKSVNGTVTDKIRLQKPVATQSKDNNTPERHQAIPPARVQPGSSATGGFVNQAGKTSGQQPLIKQGQDKNTAKGLLHTPSTAAQNRTATTGGFGKQGAQFAPAAPQKNPASNTAQQLQVPPPSASQANVPASVMPALLDRPQLLRPHSSVGKLVRIAQQALTDSNLAERIFNEPDVVAVQYQLSNQEKLVLRHMNRSQFMTANSDSSRIVAGRKMKYTPAALARVEAIETRPVVEARMIVGRAILAAVGRSYLSAADAHNCCPWGKSIELGISSDPGFYNAVFTRAPTNAIRSAPIR